MQENPLETGKILTLPTLSESLGLESPRFEVAHTLMGGMGVVAKLEHPDSESDFALKMVRKEFAGDRDFWHRFDREMRIWVQLSECEGVVPALHICRVNELPCVIAPWLPAGNLSRVLTSKDPRLFYGHVLRIVSTLEWAHRHLNVIHRDLKPANILINSEGQAQVSDWGIAKILDSGPSTYDSRPQSSNDASSPWITEAGMFLGTVVYASPEQLLGKPDIDFRADMYSLGCIMFEWEAGTPPFVGSTREEVVHGHLSRIPPKLGGLFKSSSFGSGKIIAKLLQKNPDDRFRTYAELIDELSRHAQKRGLATRSIGFEEAYAMPPLDGVNLSAEPCRRWIDEEKRCEYRLFEFADLTPDMRRIESLLTLHDWEKAASAISELIDPETLTLIRPLPHWMVALAGNLGWCRVMLGEPTMAVQIFEELSSESDLSEPYFVNYSLARLHLGQWQRAEEIAQAGLLLFPDDLDILGNLTIALNHQERLREALASSELRLAGRRDVHSLEERAAVLERVGSSLREQDFPSAASYHWEAIRLLEEALDLNPRFSTAAVSLIQIYVDLGNPQRAMDEVDSLDWDDLHENLWEPVVLSAARALDAASAHRECVDFCKKWIEVYPQSIGLQRIQAETIADGFCIGKERNGARIRENHSFGFFAQTIRDHKNRTHSDFCYMARIMEWLGDKNEALRLIEEAESIWPGKWDTPLLHGAFEWRAENFESASRLATTAKDRAPWRGQPKFLLASILESQGEERQAALLRADAEATESRRDELIAGQNLPKTRCDPPR